MDPQTLLYIIVVLAAVSLYYIYQIAQKLNIASFDGSAGGPAKGQIEFDHRGFFPGGPDGISYSYPPDYDYMNQFYNADFYMADGQKKAIDAQYHLRNGSSLPYIARLNTPGLAAYPQADQRSQYENVMDDAFRAGQFGAVKCENGLWVANSADCQAPVAVAPPAAPAANMAGFDNSQLYKSLGGM